MKELVTYLTFDGNCREAMTFYAKALDAPVEIMPFADIPGEAPSPEHKDRVMHARLKKGEATLMASDSMPGMPFTQGSNFAISVHCESRDEVTRLFTALGEGGTVTMELQDTFWNAYFGMLTDRFGINWMFNFELAPQA